MDSYLYPGTDVLKNIPGIRGAVKLQQFEYEQTASRIVELRRQPLPERFDLAQLQAIHKYLFQDVYEWAGRLRTVNIAKGGTLFALPQYIESEGRRMSTELRAENNLQGLLKDQFVARLAYYYSEWNAAHVFRDGNGRSTRVFLGQLALGAGYVIDQARIDNDQGQWNQAARRSMAGDVRDIERIFDAVVRPVRSVAFETLPADEALAQHPELAPVIANIKVLQMSLEQRFPSQIDSQEKYLTEARSQRIKKLDGGEIPILSPSKTIESPPPSRER